MVDALPWGGSGSNPVEVQVLSSAHLSGLLAQLVRAPRLHRGGRRFESLRVHFSTYSICFFWHNKCIMHIRMFIETVEKWLSNQFYKKGAIMKILFWILAIFGILSTAKTIPTSRAMISSCYCSNGKFGGRCPHTFDTNNPNQGQMCASCWSTGRGSRCSWH